MAFSTVAQQDKLKARMAPYWHRLATGQHLGFRKTRTSCTWLARAYDGQRQVKRSLGDFADLQPNERFSAAAKSARTWFAHLDAGGSVEVVTVRQACARYAADIERTGGRKGRALSPEAKAAKAKEARRRFAQYVDGDPIARIALPKLHKRHVDAWRSRLENTPAVFQRSGKGAGRGKGKGTRTRPRAAATVDRDMACLRAALELALEDGFVLSAAAWRKALKPSGAQGTRYVYLTLDQRRALIHELPDDLAAFVHGLSVLPLRPGALAALRRGDFDARAGTLEITVDKSGAGRSLLLPASTIALLKVAAKSKLPTAPLFARADGKKFRADEWVKAIKVAARAAELPAETVAYSLRHSGITDLVVGGMDLLTIAKLSGTSIAMIENTYGKFRERHARDGLERLTL